MNVDRAGLPVSTNGLGDVLQLTAICKQFPNCIIQLTPQQIKYLSLFNGFQNTIEIVEKPTLIKNDGMDHFIQQKLRAIGGKVDDYLPQINITKTEYKNAQLFLKQYENDKPMVILCVNCKNREEQGSREGSIDMWKELLLYWSQYYNFIHFGLSNIITDQLLSLVPIQIVDLDLRLLASCYKVIGKYFGIDTGDLHLAVACNCQIQALVPSSYQGYYHHFWHYKFPHIKYTMFQDYKNLLTLNRLFDIII